MPNLTLEAFLPFMSFMQSSAVMSFPVMSFPSTLTIRSPASNPTFSDGPPLMTLMMRAVSFCLVKDTPMPEKLPFRLSIAASVSLAVV